MVKSVGYVLANPKEWESSWSASVKESEGSEVLRLIVLVGVSRVQGTKATACQTHSRKRFMV